MLLKLLFLLLSISRASQFVVWNVGQGQWATEIHPHMCLHFDLGGEFNISSTVATYCHDKKNFMFLSHWDWDHISFALKYSEKIPNSCLAALPFGSSHKFKMNLLQKIRICSDQEKAVFENYLKIDFHPQNSLHRRRLRTPNDLSQVIEARSSSVLLPGDSPVSQEIFWKNNVSRHIRGLVLGHHGSKTSTSQGLLDRARPRWAVASARHKKYGHPHPRVIQLLKKAKIPLLKTEDWGHLHFFYPSTTLQNRL